MNNNLPSIKKSVLLIFLGFVLGFGVALGYTFFNVLASGEINISTSKLQIAMLLGELLIPVPLLIWTLKQRLPMKKVFRLHPVKATLYPPAILAGLGLIVLLDEFDRVLSEFFTVPDSISEMETLLAIDSVLSAVLIIGVIVILGPFVEELIFRGFFQKVLEARLANPTKAVLFSALTFAVLHFNPWWLIQIYILGFFMAYFAYRTGSILIPLAIHALNNGISVLASQYADIELSWYLWHEHVNPIIIIIALVSTYWGVKKFIALSEVSSPEVDL